MIFKGEFGLDPRHNKTEDKEKWLRNERFNDSEVAEANKVIELCVRHQYNLDEALAISSMYIRSQRANPAMSLELLDLYLSKNEGAVVIQVGRWLYDVYHVRRHLMDAFQEGKISKEVLQEFDSQIGHVDITAMYQQLAERYGFKTVTYEYNLPGYNKNRLNS